MVEIDVTETREQLLTVSNLSVKNTLTLLFQHFLKQGPQTDDELSFFIKEFLHLQIPDQPICANHVTPLKMISDLYFEKVQSVFGFANRSGGKTQNVATLNFLDSFFKQVKITSAGATLDQSGLAYDYYLNFWNEPLINQHVLIERSVQSETILSSGGRVNIVSGTRAGLNGQHPNKARIDEIELIDWGILQEGLSMSITVENDKGKFLGQDCLTSTRKNEVGTVQRILNEAKQRHIEVYSWCVLESMQKCVHDCHNFKKTHPNDPMFQNTKQCPIYETTDLDGSTTPFCYGAAHGANGFIHVEEVIRKTRILDKGTLDLQWLCKKGKSDAAVYRNHYAENVHEITHDQFLTMMEKAHGSHFHDYIQQRMRRVGGIDFGGNHATLIALKDPNTSPLPTFYFVDEHYRLPPQDVLNAQHVKDIKKLTYYKKGLLFWGDHAQRQDILEFQSMGLNVREANKSVFAGIDYVKTLMKRQAPNMKPSFYVLKDRCPNLAKQLNLYAHPKRNDGTIDVDRIITQQDDHAPDACRYAVYSDKTIPIGYRTYKAKI